MRGASQDLLDILIQDAYETIIEHANKSELSILRLQLLFVKKAIFLLHECKYDDYFILIGRMVSPQLNLFQYERFFKNGNNNGNAFKRAM